MNHAKSIRTRILLIVNCALIIVLCMGCPDLLKKPGSRDASLGLITMSVGGGEEETLPGFEPGTFDYRVNIPAEAGEVVLSAKPADERATVNAQSAALLRQYLLPDTEWNAQFLVTPEDYTAGIKIYTVKVVKAPAALSGEARIGQFYVYTSKNSNENGTALEIGQYMTDNTSFSSGVFAHAITVPDSTQKMKIDGLPESGASISAGNGWFDLDTAADYYDPADGGSWRITVTVRAANGAAQDYVFTVTKAPPSNDPTLASITIKEGTKEPQIRSAAEGVPLDTAITFDNAAWEAASVMVSAVTSYKAASISLTGGDLENVTLNSGEEILVSLAQGNTTITITVRAETGETLPYHLTVPKINPAAGVDPSLSGLRIDSTTNNITGFLSTKYSYELTYNYYQNADTHNSVIKITPLAVQPEKVAIYVNESSTPTAHNTPADVNLSPGRNTIPVTIRPWDYETSTSLGTALTYTIYVNNYPAGTPTVNEPAGGAGEINVSWGKINGASSYEVRYSTGTDMGIAPVWAGAIPETSTSITGLSAGVTYNVWVRAIAGTTDATKLYSDYSVMRYATTFSSTARLSALNVTGATLSPGFSADTYNYSVNMYNQASLTVTATTQNSGTVAMNGSAATSEFPKSLTLTKGINTVTIAVTPQSGGTVQNYTITVNNYPAAEPVFSSTNITPGVYSSNKTGQLALTWTAVSNADGYRVLYSTVNDMNSINTTGTLTASSGAVTITSQSTVTYTLTGLSPGTTYYIFVQTYAGSGTNRLYSAPATGIATTPANDARLSALAYPGNPLIPPFNPDVDQYELTGDFPNGTNSVAIGSGGFTAVVYSSGATPAIQSGSSLAVGLNSVVIRVETLYGTKKDYTVKVYKKPPAPAWNNNGAGTLAGKPFTNPELGSITLNWTAVSGTEAADGYEVYQNTQPSTIYGGNTYLVSGQGTENRAVSLAADNKYYFYIRAYKTTAGKTVYSDYSTADNAAQTISTWYSLDNLAHNETSASPFSYSPGMTGYDLLNVKYLDAASIGIKPTYSNDNDIASVKVNGVNTNSGATATYNMNDDTFSANIPIVVQAQHPSYSKTYTINVTRRGIRIGPQTTGDDDYATLGVAISVKDTLYLDEGQTIPVANPISIINRTKTLRTVPGQAGVVTINVNATGCFSLNATTLNLGASGVSTPITITGIGSRTQPSGSVLIYPNANEAVITVNMYSGVILQNTVDAIDMSNSSSVFNFYGGLIHNCYVGVRNLASSRVNQYGGLFGYNGTDIYSP